MRYPSLEGPVGRLWYIGVGVRVCCNCKDLCPEKSQTQAGDVEKSSQVHLGTHFRNIEFAVGYGQDKTKGVVSIRRKETAQVKTIKLILSAVDEQADFVILLTDT